MKSFWSRRDFLFQSAGGVSGVALAWLLDQQGMLAADRAVSSGACEAKPSGPTPFLSKKPHFAPRATSVISLFMSGGVSHVDTFDPKPALRRYSGQPLTGKGEVIVRQGNPGPLMPSPFTFRKYGQSGLDVSEIFPSIAEHTDELAVLRSVLQDADAQDHKAGQCDECPQAQDDQQNVGGCASRASDDERREDRHSAVEDAQASG